MSSQDGLLVKAPEGDMSRGSLGRQRSTHCSGGDVAGLCNVRALHRGHSSERLCSGALTKGQGRVLGQRYPKRV